jgi:hypothetical protein
MSLNYYLFCKKSYDKIISDLENIISKFEEIDELAKEEKDLFTTADSLLFNQTHNINFFYERKEHIRILRALCNMKIFKMCNHEFIEDTIDIDPDRSKNIRYCKICEYTDPNIK